MKVRSSLVIPILAASVLLPTTGLAKTTVDTKQPTSAIAGTQVKSDQESSNEKGHEQKGEKRTEKQNEMMAVVNQYAPVQLKNKLTKDFATRVQLKQQLRSKRKTSASETGEDNEQNEQKKPAHQEQKNENEQNEKNEPVHQKQKDGNKQNKHAVEQKLDSAIQKKDSKAIVAALEKLDKQLVNENKLLAQKIASIK